jgi:hypothetical protein
MLRRSDISGYVAKSVVVLSRAGVRATVRLWELSIVGWGGMASAASGISLNHAESCPTCGLLVYDSFTRPEELVAAELWDGSDLFFVWPLPRVVLATQRVADLLRENRVRGVDLRPVSELEPRGDFLTPGRLSRWLPEPQASAIGIPLGNY